MKSQDNHGGFFERNIKNRYFKIGLTAFLTVAACMLFFFIVYKISGIFGFIGKIFHILQPIIIGMVIAYLVNPLYIFLRKNLSKLQKKSGKPVSKFRVSLVKAICIFLSIAVLVSIVFFLFYMVVPQLYESVAGLVSELPEQIEVLLKKIDSFSKKDGIVYTALANVFNFIEKWANNDLPKLVNSWAPYITSGVISTVSAIFNVIIGIIVAVYILNRKELFLAQSKKVVCSALPEKAAGCVFSVVKTSHTILSNFINGKIIDSLVIAVLCFLGVTLLDMPYTLLVSAVIGVTNVIPVFGPYIGAVPCAILIGINNPLKGLYFVIFIILLQTLDGNILGPKIIGDATGLNPFWVMFSILIGGGLFGVIGMIIGAPLFAVVYKLLKELTESKLEKKSLPQNTVDYYGDDVYGLPDIKTKKK